MTRKCLTLFCLGLLLLTVSATKAARIDTLSVESPKMKKNIEVLVIVPDQCKASAPCPTVYLLHGYSKATGTERKELFLIPSATHIKTYYVPEYVDQVVAKLAAFFNDNL